MSDLISIEDAIVEKVRALPADKQQKVLEYVESLQTDGKPRSSKDRVKGMWRHLGVDLSEDEIDENRREMLRGFPRDEP
jgi:hypothetical protein